MAETAPILRQMGLIEKRTTRRQRHGEKMNRDMGEDKKKKSDKNWTRSKHMGVEGKHSGGGRKPPRLQRGEGGEAERKKGGRFRRLTLPGVEKGEVKLAAQRVVGIGLRIVLKEKKKWGKKKRGWQRGSLPTVYG